MFAGICKKVNYIRETRNQTKQYFSSVAELNLPFGNLLQNKKIPAVLQASKHNGLIFIQIFRSISKSTEIPFCKYHKPNISDSPGRAFHCRLIGASLYNKLSSPVRSGIFHHD